MEGQEQDQNEERSLESILNDPEAAEDALYNAIEFNDNQQMIENILEAKPDMLNMTSSMNETPLVAAVLDGNVDAFNFIMSKDPILDTQSFIWGTALTTAIFFKRTEMANSILQSIFRRENFFNGDKHPGAFLWAIKNNNIDLVKEMLRMGADVNSLSNKEYQKVDRRFYQYMLGEVPFNLSPNYFAFDLPLNIAIKEEKKEIVDILMDAGASLDLEGFMGQSPRQLLEYPERIEIKNRINEKISAKLQYFSINRLKPENTSTSLNASFSCGSC